MEKLTAKQEKFVQEYISSFSVKQALKTTNFKFEKYDKDNQSFYVYFLIGEDKIFYVGKGKGNRLKQHCRNAGNKKGLNLVKTLYSVR